MILHFGCSDCCWDADRLDLGRVGKRPHPKYLSKHANLLIEDAYEWSVS